MTLIDVFSVLCISGGVFFFLAGAVALLRFPDTLTRLHALTKADNLGLGLVVLGLAAAGRELPRRSEAVSRLDRRATGRNDAEPTDWPHRERQGVATMSATFVLDASLAALTLGVAAYAIFARQAFSAIVAFITYGLLLALVWVRLSAVDVALTEAAIGSGVTGALLIGAAARVGDGEGAAPADLGPLAKTLCALLCALATAGLAAAVLSLPLDAPTLAPLAVQELPKTGLGNPVTGVSSRLSRNRHAPGVGGACRGADRRLVLLR